MAAFLSHTRIEGISAPVWPGPLKGDPYRVLVVDDDPVCLKLVEQMLKHCNYAVSTCTNGKDALERLRTQADAFDLVLSDVYMPDMDGFRLLEHVGLELDLPVIMMSSNGETSVVLQGVTHGAVDFLIKPVRVEELRNMWQHVVRRKRSIEGQREMSGSGDEGSEDGKRSERKRKERRDSDDAGSAKKQRVVWSQEMHQQFVEAVQKLGIEKAVPKKILDLMPDSNLTRENVASHLQKYRAALKRGLQDPGQMHMAPRGSTLSSPLCLDMGYRPMGHNPAMDLAHAHHMSTTANPGPLGSVLHTPVVGPSHGMAVPFMAACAPHLPQLGGFVPQHMPANPQLMPMGNGAMDGLLHSHSNLMHMSQPVGPDPMALQHMMNAGLPSQGYEGQTLHATVSDPRPDPVHFGEATPEVDHPDHVPLEAYHKAATASSQDPDLADFYRRHSEAASTSEGAMDPVVSQGLSDAYFRDQLLQQPASESIPISASEHDKPDINDDILKLFLE